MNFSSTIVFVYRIWCVVFFCCAWLFVPVAFAAQTNFSLTIDEIDDQGNSVVPPQTPPQSQERQPSRRSSGNSPSVAEITPPLAVPVPSPVIERQNEPVVLIQQVKRLPNVPVASLELDEDNGSGTQQRESQTKVRNVTSGSFFDSFEITIDTRQAAAGTYDAFGAEVDAPLVISITVSLLSVGISAISTRISLFT